MVHVFPGISTTLSFPKSPTQLKQDEKYEDDRAKEKCLLEFPAISLRSFAKFSKNWKKIEINTEILERLRNVQQCSEISLVACRLYPAQKTGKQRYRITLQTSENYMFLYFFSFPGI